MHIKVCDFIEAPLYEGSSSRGSELAYSIIKQTYSSSIPANFKDYIEYVKVKKNQDRFGTKNISEVLTKCENVRLNIIDSFKKGNFPFIVGGDHSVAMASIAAASEEYGINNLAVIYIDGHCDINTEKTSMTHNIHGMPLASSIGLCGYKLKVGKLRKKVYGKNIIILGARSIDDLEFDIINKNGVSLYKNTDFFKLGFDNISDKIKQIVKDKKVHISLDVDVLDSNEFVSTGYVMPYGLSLNIVKEIINFLFRTFDVISLDLVEYNPCLDKTGKDLLAIMELVYQIEELTKMK